jgi:hypothetical protein
MKEMNTETKQTTFINGLTAQKPKPSNSQRSMRRTSIEGVPTGHQKVIGREGEVPLRRVGPYL